MFSALPDPRARRRHRLHPAARDRDGPRPDADAGLASGIVNVSLQMSGAIGLAVLGTISTDHARSLVADGHPLPSALTGGYQLAFLFGAACVALGAVLAFVLLRTPPPPAEPASEPARATRSRSPSPGRLAASPPGRPLRPPLATGDHDGRAADPGSLELAESAPRLRSSPTGRGETPNYAGYKVVANDGEIGHIDSFAIAPDEAHLVVDTGGWLFGRMSADPCGRGARRQPRLADRADRSHQAADQGRSRVRRSAGYGAYRERATDYYGPMM